MYIPRTKIKVASDSDRRKVPHTQDDKPDQISHPVDSILSPDNAKLLLANVLIPAGF